MIALAHARGSHRFDWIHRRKNGGAVPIEVTLTPIELDGRQVVLAVWHDLTERKQFEQSLIPLLAGSPQASLMKELAEHVDSYDFDAALDTLTRLEAEILGE